MNSAPDAATTRNTERTRRAVIEAARESLLEQGTAFPLARVAQAAGVSKSGLLHHFNSKNELLVAVAEDSIELFRAEVMRFVDLSENQPGKVLRAYVRALCGGSELAMNSFAYNGVWAQLMHVPGVAAIDRRDYERWDLDLAADGLDPRIILLVRHAAEGVAGSTLYNPAFGAEQLQQARDLLLDLAQPGGLPAVHETEKQGKPNLSAP